MRLQELTPPSGTPVERPREPHDYERVHADLHPLLDHISPVADRRSAVAYFNGLGIDDPVEYETSWDVFRSLVSLASLGETSFRAFAATAEQLGPEPTVLVAWITHTMFPKILVAVKLDPAGYLAYYAEEDVKASFGL